MNSSSLNALKVPELKEALESRGLPATGLKAELVERLKAALECDGGDASAMDPTAGSSETETAAPSEDLSATVPPVQETPAATSVGTDAAVEAATNAVADSGAEAPAQSEEADRTGKLENAGPGDSAAEVGAKRSASVMGETLEQAPAKKPAAALPDDPNLPPPWQAYHSQRTGKTYWYNPDTKETTWIYPGMRHISSPAALAAVPAQAGSYGGTPASGGPTSSAPAAPAPAGLVSRLAPAVNAGTGQLPIRPGAVKCKHFLRFGVCKYAEECRYDHPPDEAGKEFDPSIAVSRPSPSMLPNGMAQTGGLPLRPSERECSFFMKTGMCKYGESCRWHHPAERQTAEVRFVKPDSVGMVASAGSGGANAAMAAMGGTQMANEWEMHMSDAGRPYYYNSRTQESTWEPPPAMMMNMMGGMMGGMMGVPNMAAMGGGVAMAAAAAGGGGGAAAGRIPPAGLVAGKHPIRPGATDCAFYVKTGSCKFGEACRYNHPAEMLGVGSGGQQGAGPGGAPDANRFKKVEIRSEMSTMVLGQPLHVSSQPVERTAEGYPLRPGMPNCSFYMKTGQCKFHDSCKFNHPHKGMTGLPDASGMVKAMGFAPMGM